jgi:hypothetical protein
MLFELRRANTKTINPILLEWLLEKVFFEPIWLLREFFDCAAGSILINYHDNKYEMHHEC